MQTNDFCKTLQFQIDSFVRKLKIENKSKNTIDTYNRTYRYFIMFCEKYEKSLSFENIREDDIYAFIQYKNNTMNKQGEIAVSTTNSIVTHLKRLFKHIERNSDKLYDFDKVFEDIKLQQPTRTPKGLSELEFKRLEKYIETVKENQEFTLTRNIILLKFMLYGGMRVSEAISIKLSDISYLQEQELYKITFIGKGNKTRITYIKRILLENDIDKLNNIFKIDKTNVIALSKTGKTMTRVRLSEAINVIYRRAGLKISGVHILRHTAAKNLLNAGVSIVIVQSILGHASIQTTSIYANPTEEIIINGLM